MARRTREQKRKHQLLRREKKARARADRLRAAHSVCSIPLALQVLDLAGGPGMHPADFVVRADELSEEHWAQLAEQHPSARTEASGPHAWLCLHCGAVTDEYTAYAALGPLFGFDTDRAGYEATRTTLAAMGVDPTVDGPSMMELAAAGDQDSINRIKLHAPWLIPPETTELEAQALAARYVRERLPE